MRRLGLFGLLLGATVTLIAVGFYLTSDPGASSSARTEGLAERPIKVVTTTGMIADAAENVGGARVRVIALMGPGVDPHLYRASEGDVRLMIEADLIFYNGLHLEGKMADLFEQMGLRGIRTVAVTDGIERSRLISAPGFPGAYDPHVWFDVSLWMEVVKHIRDALIELDPAYRAHYEANAARFLEELSALHEYVSSQAQRVPEEGRVLITAHDAFGYFGRVYHFEVRGLQGISTVAEAGIEDIQRLAEFIVARRIPAIFAETTTPPQPIEALQAAVRSRGFEVIIGGELFSDAMGNPGTPEGTYIGMVRHNIDTIVSALLRE
jgi:manganese/zinc/iron transport system substrate-binding protein